MLKGLAACFHGYHLLNESQWEEGIKYVEDGVKDFQHLYGNCGDICLGFILLNAYLQSGYIEKVLIIESFNSVLILFKGIEMC